MKAKAEFLRLGTQTEISGFDKVVMYMLWPIAYLGRQFSFGPGL